MRDDNIVLPMPETVRDFVTAHRALVQHFANARLKFTLDGRLVGDLAEAIALEHFALMLPERRTKGVDALTKAGRTVQIKATGLKNRGPAFTPGHGFAEYLLFFRLDFEANTASVLSNGPEAPVRALLPEKWEGTRTVSLSAIQSLARECAPEDAIPSATRLAATQNHSNVVGTPTR